MPAQAYADAGRCSDPPRADPTLGREPTGADLATASSLTIARVERAQAWRIHPVPLDLTTRSLIDYEAVVPAPPSGRHRPRPPVLDDLDRAVIHHRDGLHGHNPSTPETAAALHLPPDQPHPRTRASESAAVVTPTSAKTPPNVTSPPPPPTPDLGPGHARNADEPRHQRRHLSPQTTSHPESAPLRLCTAPPPATRQQTCTAPTGATRTHPRRPRERRHRTLTTLGPTGRMERETQAHHLAPRADRVSERNLETHDRW